MRLKHPGFAAQIVLLGLCVAAIMSLTFVYVIPYLDSRLHRYKTDEVRHLVTATARLVAGLSGSGEMDHGTDRQVALRRAISALTDINSEYFWINDLDGVMIVHPVNPELEGRSQWDFQDGTGKFIFQEFSRAARAGGGFVEYLWPKPGGRAPVAKISYVAPVPGQPWLVGSGLYLDDLAEEIGRLTYTLMLIAAAKLLMVAVACFLLGRSYAQPVKEVLDLSRAVEEGDLSRADLVSRRHDELGGMARALNSMKNSLRDDVRIILGASHLVGLASGEIRQSASDLSGRVQGRAAAGQELHAALAELAANFKAASDMAGGLNNDAGRLIAGTEGQAELARRISDLAATIWEQAITLEEMTNGLADLDRGIQADAAMVEELSDASGRLDEEAQSLIAQMSRFRLDAA